MRTVDLHTHSTKSDGTLTPSQLVELAIHKGLAAFALTDHDNVSGIGEALKAAREAQLAGRGDVEVVPGIEFSTEYHGIDVHIVGLYYDCNSPEFRQEVKEFTEARDRRNREMCDKMAADGIPISYEKLREAFPDSVITRAHFGRYLKDTGYISDIREAFDRLIGDDCPYFIPRKKISPQKAVEFLLKFHGIPILAHPFQYELGDDGLDRLVRELKEAGLMGIEAFYCKHTPEMTKHVTALAQKYDLLLSGGSDFHGDNKPGLEMGTGYGHLCVPEECLTKMKHRAFHVTEHTKIFFCDFDGTLATSTKEISPKTREALGRFVSRGKETVREAYACAPEHSARITAPGNIFVLSSGRAMSDVKNLLKRLDLPYPNMYLSGYNGAEVYSVSEGVTCFRDGIPREVVRGLFDLAGESGIYVHTYDGDTIVLEEPEDGKPRAEINVLPPMDEHCRDVVEGRTPNVSALDESYPAEARYYTAFVKMPVRREQDAAASLAEAPCKVLAIHLNNPEDHCLEKFAELVHQKYPGKINTVLSNPYYLELDPAGATKGYSLTWLCRHLGIDPANSAAAGDAPNDLPMIEAAGLGIGMCNAMIPTEELRRRADVITETDNDHDGLAPILDTM